VSADGRTGDGAGILLIFLMIFLKVCDFTIPKRASMQWEWFYQKKKADFFKTTFETAIRNQNLNIIGWRDVPVDVSNRTNRSRKK
jgi:glutamate synthase (ferredoxin)